MKKKVVSRFFILNSLLLAMVTMMLTGKANAQPHSSYWHVNELLEWDKDTDPDAVFNKGTIPLAQKNTSYQVNDQATDKNQIMALSTMYKHTSGAPSQGDDQFDVYAFSYWQYVDKLIMWGGSAGEGTIVAPNSDTINVAHKNGVEVYGTVFFPPTVYGGNVSWVRQFLQKDSQGNFPVADKLIEVANYYGFEGWFINQETHGTNSTDAKNMQDFIKYCNAQDPDFKVVWYDAMTKDGYVWWQDKLNANNGYFMRDSQGNKVSDSIFIDFGWGNSSMISSYNYANAIGLDPYMVFSGIEMGARNGIPDSYIKSSLDAIHGDGITPRTSLGIFCQSESYKTDNTNFQQFMDREDRFWSGDYVDPTKTTGSWPGIAGYFVAKTPITSYPFVTHFNMGNGYKYYVNGEVKNPNPWHNRSLQDILPTWRWIRECTGTPLNVGFDYEDAYQGGSSLKVSGTLNEQNRTHIKLYKTYLPIESVNPQLKVTYKSNQQQNGMEVGLAFKSNPENYIFTQMNTQGKDSWIEDSFSIDGHQGDTLVGISLRFSSEVQLDDYQINIGEIKIQEGNDSEVNIQNAKIDKVEFRDAIFASLKLSWDQKDDIHHYEVYRVLPSGEKQMIGATISDHYYVQEFKRESAEHNTVIEIVSVSKTMKRGIGIQKDFTWPSYPAPVAEFKVSTTFASTTETVTFTSLSSDVTESLRWSITNEAGSEVFTSEEAVVNVVFDNPGNYTVTLTAINSEGQHTKTVEDLVLIKQGPINVSNVAYGKSITGDHQVHSGEAFSMAVDGNTSTKWCATGPAPHWIRVDLGQEYTLYKFVLKHAEEGGESPAWNTYDYQILVSQDNVNWTELVTVEGNTDGITEHAVKHVKGRYVKLNVTKPTSGGDTAVRLYEFETWGYNEK